MKKSVLVNLICSLIAVVVLMLAVVLIMVFTGVFGIEPQRLVISSASSIAVYDGEPLTDSGWHLLEGELKEGHRLSVTVSGSQTNVGISENYVSAIVLDENGADVSEDYKIEYKPGSLNVKQRSIHITAGSDMKIYDGTALTFNGYTVESALSLISKHELSVTVDGSITEVGVAKNRITEVVITNSKGQDVTYNYNVRTTDGTLAVYETDTIVIKSATDAKCYDGLPLKNSDWELVSGMLETGDVFKVRVTGSQTEVGTSDNVFEVQVFNSSGMDVTSRYTIVCIPGTLTVIRQAVKIESADASKPYDGTPLTCNEYTVIPSELLNSGLKFEVKITGSQTAVGSSDNTILECKITDSNGADMSKYYDVFLYPGTLTVTEATGDNSSTSGSLDMSGSLGGGAPEGDALFFKVLAEKDDVIYLKLMSYGDFNDTKNGWNTAPAYGRLTEDQLSAYYITALALENSGLETTQVKITPETQYVALPYYTINTGLETQTSDVSIIGNATGDYYASYYNWEGKSGVVLPSRYREYEAEYLKYVRQNYLSIDTQTLAFMQGIINEEGFSSTDRDIINKVAQYIKTAARYNLKYDTAMDSESNVVISFLSDYKEGVCRHYASAATLLYRALGIPARYTVGFAAPVEAGELTDVTAKYAHAWVEVYVSGIGWVNVEVTGSGNAATGSDKPQNMTITPTYTGKKYDGTTLYANQAVNGFSNLQKEGYTYKVTVSGENSELGIKKSTVTQFIIYDPFGVEVYNKQTGMGSDKYIIKYADGQIQQYLSDLKFESKGYEKIYDGKALEITVDDCKLVSGTIYSGYTCVISKFASLTNVGQINSEFTVQIFKDGVDCTTHYRITRNYGRLTVKAKELTIKAADAEKPYDGNTLKCNEIEFDESVLAEGDYIASYTVLGSQTNIGKSSNVIKTIVIKNKDGKDVTGNYILKFKEGVLSVTLP